MADELYAVLTRFHREVVVPDIERIVDERIAPLRREMLDGFGHIYAQLDRLETEYQALKAGVRRLEEKVESLEKRVASIETKLDRMALRSELMELKERVLEIEHRIAQLEAGL